MHRFYAQRTGEAEAQLGPEEAAHALRVLRLGPGDRCCAIVEEALYAARVLQTAPQVTLALEERLPSPEPSVSVTRYQGLPKGDKMEYIIQKCTEAGICRVVPVLFSRCVAKWDARDAEKKLPRWQRIAQEAAKQSGRAALPRIEPPLTLPQLCQALPGHALALAPWEEARGNGIRRYFSGQRDAALIIGPEGGVAPEEMARLAQAGALPVTLGPRILRTETAGLAALVSLLTLSGDME